MVGGSGSQSSSVSPPSSPQGPSSQSGQPPPPPSLSENLAALSPQENGLLAPVHIPEDPNAVIKSGHPSTAIIANSGLVVQRQFEMLNIFLGFEQANRYVILDPQGNHIGYMAEHDGGLAKSLGRQAFRTHRAFTTNIFDRTGNEVLRFNRPFSLINSRIRVYDACERDSRASSASTSSSTAMTPSEPLANSNILSNIPLEHMRIIGEAQQQWAPLRRKYNLFLFRSASSSSDISDTSQNPANSLALSRSSSSASTADGIYQQFAKVDEAFLSWDFSLKSSDDRILGSVSRNWAGFGRELFTDTGVYALRMDSAAEGTADTAQDAEQQGGKQSVLGPVEGMTLDQRAVMLATAVSIDFDYFSRHSGHGTGLPLPMWFPFGGGGGAAEAGEGAETGAVVGGGAMTGAGTMAGYEAMQRGAGVPGGGTEGTPPGEAGGNESGGGPPNGEWANSNPDAHGATGETWGQGNDPWGGGGGGGGGGGDEGGDGEGGGLFGNIDEWFSE